MSGPVTTRETSQEIQYQPWGLWDVTLVVASVAAVALAIFVDMPVFFGMALVTSMYTVCADRSYTVVNNTITNTTNNLPPPPERSDDSLSAQLRQAIANNRAAGEAHEREVARLNAEPARLQAEIDRLTDQIAGHLREIADYEKVNGELVDEIVEIEGELKLMEDLVGTLSFSMGNMEQEKAALKREMQEMKERVSGPPATPMLNKHLDEGSARVILGKIHQQLEQAYRIIRYFLILHKDDEVEGMEALTKFLYSDEQIDKHGEPIEATELVTQALQWMTPARTRVVVQRIATAARSGFSPRSPLGGGTPRGVFTRAQLMNGDGVKKALDFVADTDIEEIDE